jgi:uncharacterized membrane protein YfhO
MHLLEIAMFGIPAVIVTVAAVQYYVRLQPLPLFLELLILGINRIGMYNIFICIGLVQHFYLHTISEVTLGLYIVFSLYWRFLDTRNEDIKKRFQQIEKEKEKEKDKNK